MKMFLDTSATKITLKLDSQTYEWEAGHDLARDLLKFIHGKLAEQGRDWQDLTEIHYFSGPGSFTGLRIGAVVVNTLADQLKIPLFDQNGKKVEIIMPEYGRPANITPPKK